jgi:hypothetical protein
MPPKKQLRKKQADHFTPITQEQKEKSFSTIILPKKRRADYSSDSDVTEDEGLLPSDTKKKVEVFPFNSYHEKS